MLGVEDAILIHSAAPHTFRHHAHLLRSRCEDNLYMFVGLPVRICRWPGQSHRRPELTKTNSRRPSQIRQLLSWRELNLN